MATSEFKRLYKELHKQALAISGDVYDPTFEREREEMLFVLGHDVPHRTVPERVRRARFHGQAVRTKRDSQTYNTVKVSNEFKEKVQKKKAMSIVTDDAEKLSKITEEMKWYIDNNQPIPNNLVKQLKKIDHTDDSSKPNGDKKCSTLRQSRNTQRSKSAGKITLPPIDQSPSKSSPQNSSSTQDNYKDIRETNKMDRSFTTSKWSAEEREKISFLYHDMEGPSNKKNKELWRLYFIAFSDRFRLFFPNRKEVEVIEKVRDMISLRQMKDVKETRFWKEL